MSCFPTACCGTLVNDYWHAGAAHCPYDGTRMEAYYHHHGGGYLLVLACSFCGKKAQITRYSDPHRGHFREWSPQEAATMAAEQSSGRHSQCPVCRARIMFRRLASPSLAVLECPRCGNLEQVCAEAAIDSGLEMAAHGS